MDLRGILVTHLHFITQTMGAQENEEMCPKLLAFF